MKIEKLSQKTGLLTLVLFVLGSATAFSAENVEITLEEAETLALKNHRSIEQAQWARESAQSQLSEIRRRTGPTLRWSSQARRIGGDSYASSRRAHNLNPAEYPAYASEWNNGLTLSIPLYTGGQMENRREAAVANLNAADLTVETRLQEVRYTVHSAYYNVLKSRDLIKVCREAVKTLQEHKSQIQQQLSAGAVAYSDLLATDVELANAELNLVSEEGNLKKAVASLNNVIGFPVNTLLEPTATAQYRHGAETLEDCQNYALAYRPDGIAAEFQVRQARATMEAAKSGYRPTVTASVSDNRAGEAAFKKDHSQSWALGLGLEWNVFDNGVTAAQVRTAEANLKTAESKLAQTKETILLEVQSAYTNLLTAEKSITTAEVGVRRAEEEYRIAQLRYIEGVDTNLAVMDAQEKLTKARTNYNNAFYAASSAKAALDKAIGLPVALSAPDYAAEIEAGKSADAALAAAMPSKETIRIKNVRPMPTLAAGEK